MFSTKRLTAIASATMLVAGAAQAQQTKPAAPHIQTVSVRVPSANLDMGSPGSPGAASPSAASQPVSQPVSQPALLAAAAGRDAKPSTRRPATPAAVGLLSEETYRT